SEECRDFRAWLSTAQDLSDIEIRKVTGGMKNQLSSLAGSTTGKTVRLAATTLIGLIPGAGLVLGPTAGAIDSFLLDRILPRSGIVAFLADIYPSLFVSA
ncbi:MAG: hypothetical protein WBM04_21025, partial [Candidatus Korobacteraceae bacterium]